jgi:bifunctional non-homologous end joining protein LigD
VQIKEQKKVGEYLVVDSVQALVGIAQGDIVEIHCWNATADRLEHPDRLVFDLDPGSDVKWRRVVEAALQLRERLENVGLESWVKLTGGKGIHVVVPCTPAVTWDEAYAFSRAVAESLVRDDPASFTTRFSKSGRTNKILLDYKRNHRAAVAVAAYSTRARPNGPVSMPLKWEELVPDLASDAFTVENFRGRMTAIRQPWEGFFDCRQSLKAPRRSAKVAKKPPRSRHTKGAAKRISTRNA